LFEFDTDLQQINGSLKVSRLPAGSRSMPRSDWSRMINYISFAESLNLVNLIKN